MSDAGYRAPAAGEVAAPYRGIVDDLRPGQTVRLIPLPA